MCETCVHGIKQAMNGKYQCNCKKSEYYTEQVAKDHICNYYKENKDTECAMLQGGRCRALTVFRCPDNASCRFYKTKSQLIEERRNATERLKALPAEQQENIKTAYNITTF